MPFFIIQILIVYPLQPIRMNILQHTEMIGWNGIRLAMNQLGETWQMYRNICQKNCSIQESGQSWIVGFSNLHVYIQMKKKTAIHWSVSWLAHRWLTVLLQFAVALCILLNRTDSRFGGPLVSCPMTGSLAPPPELIGGSQLCTILYNVCGAVGCTV